MKSAFRCKKLQLNKFQGENNLMKRRNKILPEIKIQLELKTKNEKRKVKQNVQFWKLILLIKKEKLCNFNIDYSKSFHFCGIGITKAAFHENPRFSENPENFLKLIDFRGILRCKQISVEFSLLLSNLINHFNNTINLINFKIIVCLTLGIETPAPVLASTYMEFQTPALRIWKIRHPHSNLNQNQTPPFCRVQRKHK